MEYQDEIIENLKKVSKIYVSYIKSLIEKESSLIKVNNHGFKSIFLEDIQENIKESIEREWSEDKKNNTEYLNVSAMVSAGFLSSGNIKVASFMAVSGVILHSLSYFFSKKDFNEKQVTVDIVSKATEDSRVYQDFFIDFIKNQMIQTDLCNEVFYDSDLDTLSWK